jgi:hypothetical protein
MARSEQQYLDLATRFFVVLVRSRDVRGAGTCEEVGAYVDYLRIA